MKRSRNSKKKSGKQNGMPETASTLQSLPAGDHSRRTMAGICALLAILVLAVFAQTLRHEFVNYDDDEYVYDNLAVTGGLSLSGIAWAFTHVYSDNWHPVTWLSHMLDCEIYGLNPWGHHLTSVLLHAASAILLFLALRHLTSAANGPSESLWRSAFVASLFAIHPLRVESVAWVAERKDILSGLFFMLTLMAYARYARLRSSGLRFPVGSYLVLILLFALGLMSKPMLVTLPFVLLLIDYWPLRRLSDTHSASRNLFPLLIEKLPLLLMAAGSSVITVIAQTEARMALEKVSLLWRFGNVLVSYATYIGQTIWPARLVVLYHHPEDQLPLATVISSALLLAAVSTAVFALRRKHPYAITGWLWFIGMLVPVIGLVQVGIQPHADRYTYLPQIGLLIIATWGIADLSAGWRHRRLVCATAAAVALGVLMACSWRQTTYWRDSLTLWKRALANTAPVALTHNSLANALALRGKLPEAVQHYQNALEINPLYVDASSNLGNILLLQGKTAEAIEKFRRALEIKPDYVNANNNLGVALASQGNFVEAIKYYQRALEIKPDNVHTHTNLGDLLLSQGYLNEAARHYRQALKINPDLADPNYHLGVVLASQGSTVEAIQHYTKALEINPTAVSALKDLAWLLATCPEASLRNGARAVELAQKANSLAGGGHPIILDVLAAAYAEAGRYSEAVETAQRALDLAARENDKALADDIRIRIRHYESGMPYHGEARKR